MVGVEAARWWWRRIDDPRCFINHLWGAVIDGRRGLHVAAAHYRPNQGSNYRAAKQRTHDVASMATTASVIATAGAGDGLTCHGQATYQH